MDRYRMDLLHKELRRAVASMREARVYRQRV